MNIQYQGDLNREGQVVPFRVFLADGLSSDVNTLISSASGLELVDDPELAQGMLIRSKEKFLSPEAFEQHPDLEQIVRVGVGIDNVRLDLASKAGVVVLNTPGASTNAVATRTVALILASAGRVVEATVSLKENEWLKGKKEVQPEDLSQKSLGVIGYGRIGKRTSELAGPFFNKVQFSDVRDLKSPNQVSLENLLSSSQVVSVNTSGDTEILTSELCELIQPGAILVITSRGESVNLEALRRLQEEKNVRVALDVFHQEGKGMFDNQMLMEVIQDKGFIGTPHTAAQDDYTQEQLGHEAAHAMIDFAQKGMVNPKNLSGLNFKSVQLSGPLDRKDKRFLIAHPSIKGTIGKIGTLVDQGGGDIRHFANDSEGFHLNGVHLAATAFDVIGVTPEQAVAIYDKIKSEIKILRGRILSYA